MKHNLSSLVLDLSEVVQVETSLSHDRNLVFARRGAHGTRSHTCPQASGSNQPFKKHSAEWVKNRLFRNPGFARGKGQDPSLSKAPRDRVFRFEAKERGEGDRGDVLLAIGFLFEMTSEAGLRANERAAPGGAREYRR
jgi:hypothetical protein